MEPTRDVLLPHDCWAPESGMLYGNGCTKCHNQFFPKRVFCPSCLSADALQSFPLPETGVLYTYTTIHTGSKLFETPYKVGYVDVNPQLRLFGHIRGESQPKINGRVRITLGPIGQDGDKTLWGVVFVPIEEGAST